MKSTIFKFIQQNKLISAIIFIWAIILIIIVISFIKSHIMSKNSQTKKNSPVFIPVPANMDKIMLQPDYERHYISASSSDMEKIMDRPDTKTTYVPVPPPEEMEKIMTGI